MSASDQTTKTNIQGRARHYVLPLPLFRDDDSNSLDGKLQTALHLLGRRIGTMPAVLKDPAIEATRITLIVDINTLDDEAARKRFDEMVIGFIKAAKIASNGVLFLDVTEGQLRSMLIATTEDSNFGVAPGRMLPPVDLTNEDLDAVLKYCLTMGDDRVARAFLVYANKHDLVTEVLTNIQDELASVADINDTDVLKMRLFDLAADIAELARLSLEWPTTQKLQCKLPEATINKLLLGLSYKLGIKDENATE